MKLKSIAFLLLTIALPAMAEKVSVNTGKMSLVLDVENGKPAQYLYFGTRLNNADLQNLKVADNGRMDAYPAYGLNTPAEAAHRQCVIAMEISLLHSWQQEAM